METYRHETIMMADYDIVSDIIDTMFEINGEMESADTYIGEAMRLKPTSPESAASKVTMSADELKHGENLALTVNKMMDKLKAENNPCYAVLAMVWYKMNDEQLRWAAKIKMKHERYKK